MKYCTVQQSSTELWPISTNHLKQQINTDIQTGIDKINHTWEKKCVKERECGWSTIWSTTFECHKQKPNNEIVWIVDMFWLVWKCWNHSSIAFIDPCHIYVYTNTYINGLVCFVLFLFVSVMRVNYSNNFVMIWYIYIEYIKFMCVCQCQGLYLDAIHMLKHV